jgi:hypothetical protein
MATTPSPRTAREAEVDSPVAAGALARVVLGEHPVGRDRSTVDSRHRTCLHEAAHCIVVLSYRSATFTRVLFVSPAGNAHVEGVACQDQGVLISVNLAGAMAEWHFIGNVMDDGVRVDMGKAIANAMQSSVDYVAGMERLRNTAESVRKLLDRRRRGLVALARVLFRVGELSFAEAKRVVENAEEPDEKRIERLRKGARP